MATSISTPAEELRPDQPILVMVAAGDPGELARLRAVTRFLPDVEVVDVDTADVCVSTIEGLYESPYGCPDVLVLSPSMAGADAVEARLRRTCPGVRVAYAADGDDHAVEALRALVDALHAAFA